MSCSLMFNALIRRNPRNPATDFCGSPSVEVPLFISLLANVICDFGQGAQQVLPCRPHLLWLVHRGQRPMSSLFILKPADVLRPALEKVWKAKRNSSLSKSSNPTSPPGVGVPLRSRSMGPHRGWKRVRLLTPVELDMGSSIIHGSLHELPGAYCSATTAVIF